MLTVQAGELGWTVTFVRVFGKIFLTFSSVFTFLVIVTLQNCNTSTWPIIIIVMYSSATF